MSKPSLLDDVQLHLVETIDDLFAFKRWVGERRETPLAVDTESSGLSPHRDVLRLVQFGDMHTGWAIPWDLWKGGVIEIIKSYEEEWVCHNLPFEQRFFKVHGGVQLPWNRCHDTMVQAAIDDPMRPKGLKPLSSKLVDATAAQGQKALDEGMKAQGWTWGTVPITFAPYWVYGALDPVLTAHLHHQLHPAVTAVAQEAYDLEMETLRVCTSMMMRGMKVDVPYVKAAIDKMRSFSIDARAWMRGTYGITSPMSGGQLARAFTRLGWEITRFTDAGAPKMDKATLEEIQKRGHEEAAELARYVLAVRHGDKMIGTYLENFLEMRDHEDIIRGNINTLAARTGRMSATDPAFQTLPRDDKAIRGSIVPREGLVLITCDLDQVEGRLGAHFSEDEGLIEAFWDADRTGNDFFCGVASKIFNDDITSKDDPRRQPTKNVFYGGLYGAGYVTMARTAGMPPEQMKPIKASFDEQFPGLQQALNRYSDEAREHNPPYLRSPLGRKLSLERGMEYTQGLNSMIQGHAAEYFKRSLVDMAAAGLEDYLLMPIHDEVMLEAPASEAEDFLKTVQECMTDRENYRVQLTAGGKIMTERWQK